MKTWLVVSILVLIVLHQDFWWWDDSSPVLGFLPIGLGWHVLISLGAGVVWWLATRVAWPPGLDDEPASEEEAVR